MRTSTAFFAGVGTVFVAIAAGVGGGLTIANVMSPQTPQYGKLDRHASSDAPSTKDPMVPVPYLAATKGSTNAAVVVSPADQKPAQQPQQSEAANSSPANSSPPATPPAPQANVTASNEQAAKPAVAAQPDVSKPSEVAAAKPSLATAQPAAREQVSAVEDAYAKARDADLKRDADQKQRDAEQKRAERRKAERRQQQQWAERRRMQPSRDQDDIRGVEQAVREDSEARAYPVYRDPPARAEFPIRLFGDD